jgi:hypothetical protein
VNGEVFDKFGWLKALQSDPHLSLTAFRLGVVICTTFTRADGTGWSVELDKIAAKLPGGLSRDRAFGSLRQLTDAGYLTETARSGGGRGVTARRSHNLTKPQPPTSAVSEKPPTQASAVYEETTDASVVNHRRKRRKPPTQTSWFVAVCADQSTRFSPTGTSSGTSSGTRAPSEPTAQPDNPPTQATPKNKDLSEKQKQKPTNDDASNDSDDDDDDKKPRPQLGGMIHKLLKTTNPDNAGDSMLSPRAQAAIDAARANLNRATRQAAADQKTSQEDSDPVCICGREIPDGAAACERCTPVINGHQPHPNGAFRLKPDGDTGTATA